MRSIVLVCALWWRWQWQWQAIVGEVAAIRAVGVSVPSEVVVRGNATFHCNYNIESDRLYSLKWYKRINERDTEFFSYISSPEQTIHHKSAPEVPGVRLDMAKSSETGEVLHLYDIDLTSEGLYKCEVSADHTFQTVKMEAHMTVIVPPTKPPVIKGYKSFYSVGEDVDCLCYPSDSKPASRVKWFVNNEEAPESYIMGSNDSVSAIRFTLENKHLIAGTLNIRCTAFIHSDLQLQVISEETLINGANQLESVPLIVGLQTNYTLGQTLQVNCTLPQPKNQNIRPKLRWLIHNEEPNAKFVKRYTTDSTIGLRFRIRAYHLDDNSALFITCVATKSVAPSAPLALKTSRRSNAFTPIIINANHLHLYLISSLLSIYRIIEII